MNKNKYYLAVAVLGLLVTTAGVSAIVSADEGATELKGRWIGQERKVEIGQHWEEMNQIFENKDFEAWKSLMADKPLAAEINEENFARMAEMHELMKSGDKDGAKDIAEELGLPAKQMGAKGQRGNPEIREAIESGDYSAWSSIMGDKPVTEIINEENFDKFVEMHNLMKSGDKDAAEEIREELGLEHKGMGFKKGFHKGMKFGPKNN